MPTDVLWKQSSKRSVFVSSLSLPRSADDSVRCWDGGELNRKFFLKGRETCLRVYSLIYVCICWYQYIYISVLKYVLCVFLCVFFVSFRMTSHRLWNIFLKQLPFQSRSQSKQPFGCTAYLNKIVADNLIHFSIKCSVCCTKICEIYYMFFFSEIVCCLP